jgi:hypothetical protein
LAEATEAEMAEENLVEAEEEESLAEAEAAMAGVAGARFSWCGPL